MCEGEGGWVWMKQELLSVEGRGWLGEENGDYELLRKPCLPRFPPGQRLILYGWSAGRCAYSWTNTEPLGWH